MLSLYVKGNFNIQKKQRGSLLVSVLLFLVVASLLVTLALNSSLLQVRMSQHFTDQDQLLQIAEQGLTEASQQLPRVHLNCQLNEQNEAFFLNKDKPWWLSTSACQSTIKEAKVSYIIENLSIYPCLRLRGEGAQQALIPVSLFRVTVFALSKNKKHHLLLQATYAQPSLQVLNCEDRIQELQAGRQSWAILE